MNQEQQQTQQNTFSPGQAAETQGTPQASPQPPVQQTIDPFEYLRSLHQQQIEAQPVAQPVAEGGAYPGGVVQQPVPQQPASQQPQGQQPEAQQPQQPVQQQPEQARIEESQQPQIDPLSQLIYSDPDLSRQVFDLISKHGRPQEEVVQEEEPPTAPARPDDYTEDDEFTPGTSSYRYRKQMEAYREQLADYRIRQAERRAEALEKKLLAQEQEREQAIAMYRAAEEIAKQRGVPIEQARNFVQFINSRNATIDDLWMLYQIKLGQAQRQGAVQQAPIQQPLPQGVPIDERGQPIQQPAPYVPPQQLQGVPGHPQYGTPANSFQQLVNPAYQTSPPQVRQPVQYPLPSVAGAGGSSPMKSPSDQLFDVLLAESKKINPFQ